MGFASILDIFKKDNWSNELVDKPPLSVGELDGALSPEQRAELGRLHRGTPQVGEHVAGNAAVLLAAELRQRLSQLRLSPLAVLDVHQRRDAPEQRAQRSQDDERERDSH